MGLMSCEKQLDPSLSKTNQDGNVEVDCWFDGSADKLCVMACVVLASVTMAYTLKMLDVPP